MSSEFHHFRWQSSAVKRSSFGSAKHTRGRVGAFARSRARRKPRLSQLTGYSRRAEAAGQSAEERHDALDHGAYLFVAQFFRRGSKRVINGIGDGGHAL